jgi:hypothetical protein
MNSTKNSIQGLRGVLHSLSQLTTLSPAAATCVIAGEGGPGARLLPFGER